MVRPEIRRDATVIRRCSFAMLLGALACSDEAGDGSMSTRSVTSMNGARDTNAPGSNPMPGPATPEMPALMPSATENGSGENGMPNPMLDSNDPPSNGSDGEGMDEPPPADPGTGAPSGSTPAPTRESATAPGRFEVTIVTTGLRDGPDYGSQTLHVPDGAEAPLAAVAIVPGFNTPESSIQPWGPFLASHGIVALTIGTNSPLDSAELRSRALLDALETLEAENERAGSPLAGKLAADRLGIMGWSLGGGGALIAASSTPSLKAAITMAAYGPGARYPNDQVPTLFLAGSADPNAGGQSQGMFASLPETTPKMLFEVRGGPHEIGNDPSNADGAIGRYGLSWLEVFLVGDDRYRQFLAETPAQASDFRQNLAP